MVSEDLLQPSNDVLPGNKGAYLIFEYILSVELGRENRHGIPNLARSPFQVRPLLIEINFVMHPHIV